MNYSTALVIRLGNCDLNVGDTVLLTSGAIENYIRKHEIDRTQQGTVTDINYNTSPSGTKYPRLYAVDFVSLDGSTKPGLFYSHEIVLVSRKKD